jgi:hypothetical protein
MREFSTAYAEVRPRLDGVCSKTHLCVGNVSGKVAHSRCMRQNRLSGGVEDTRVFDLFLYFIRLEYLGFMRTL